jgi:hypothetical protein
MRKLSETQETVALEEAKVESYATFTPPDNSVFHEKLKRLADRLGVEPMGDRDGGFRIVLDAGDSKYDLMDLMHAALDKIDAATKNPGA